jgi:hypothetical protein
MVNEIAKAFGGVSRDEDWLAAFPGQLSHRAEDLKYMYNHGRGSNNKCRGGKICLISQQHEISQAIPSSEICLKTEEVDKVRCTFTP